MSNEEVIDMPENIPTLIVIPVITALSRSHRDTLEGFPGPGQGQDNDL